MNKEILMTTMVILITLKILTDGYLKGFLGQLYINIINYKKIAIIGIIITIFSVIYLDLPIASKFSNKYYTKTLESIENGFRTASPKRIKELKNKRKIEKINKDRFSKYEKFLATQGEGDVAGGIAIIFLLIGILFRKNFLIKTSKNAIMSILASGILVNLIKYIISRLRPDVNMLPYQFFNWASWFNGNGSINPFKSASASMPSGHGIVSVALAFSFYYGYKNILIRTIAISYAIILSGARIYGTRHWLSDVISAVFLGMLVAKTIYKINENREENERGSNFFN